jgi:uncharacterized protein (TIGR02118 family)
MVKVTVLYGKPVDAEAFERYYAETHMPIVHRAGLARTEASKVVGTTDGSEPKFHRIFDIWYDDMEQLQKAMGTPAVNEMREDLKNFATGGVQILISVTEPEASTADLVGAAAPSEVRS